MPAKKTKETAAEKTTVEKTAAVEAATEEKAAPKKTAAKKAATKVVEKVVVEYAGGQVDTDTLVAKAKEVIGKKTVKELNVYYQPETGMVYFTADGNEGKFNL